MVVEYDRCTLFGEFPGDKIDGVHVTTHLAQQGACSCLAIFRPKGIFMQIVQITGVGSTTPPHYNSHYTLYKRSVA
jgi:hypothetical protein